MLEPKVENVQHIEEKTEHPEDMSLAQWLDGMNKADLKKYDRLYVKLYFIRPNGERYGWLTIYDISRLYTANDIGDRLLDRLKVELNQNGTRIYPPYIRKFEDRLNKTKVRTIYTDEVKESDPGYVIWNKNAVRYDLLLEVP